jgi:hypothetical protein
MNINEATMSVNIAGVPRPFRIITKEQGKKEYGAPFYEQVAGTLRGVADRIRSSASDARSARTMVKETFEKLGMEPVQKAGFLIQLMRYKDAAALADALYDITIDGPDGQAFVVGESELNDQKSSFSEAWDAQSEDERAKHLSMAGYDGEELSAYKKFTWDNLPPAVRNHVEVVMESYNPGAADIRLPFHGDNIPKAEVEPEAEEEPAEEPEEEPEAEEEPTGDVVFENARTAVGFFRKMSGMTEAEEPEAALDDPEAKADHKATKNPYKSAGKPIPGEPKDTPELLALLAKAAEGDEEAKWKVAMQFEKIINYAAKSAVAVGNAYAQARNAKSTKRTYGYLTPGDQEDLASDGLLIAKEAAAEFDPNNPDRAKFSTFLRNKLRGLNNKARMLVTSQVRTVGDEPGDARKRGSAGDDSAHRLSPTKGVPEPSKPEFQSGVLPSECEKALAHILDTRIDPKYAAVIRAVYKIGEPPEGDEPKDVAVEARGKNLPRSFDAVNNKLGIKNAFYLFQQGMKQLRKVMDDEPELIEPCRDFLLGTTQKDHGKEGDDVPPLDELIQTLFEHADALSYPSEMVAKNMEALMLAEGVKVRRKGKRIHVPVNEYGRAKKAFEKHGLTIPKKMVSNDGETVRKMTRFAGLYGASILDTPY